MTITQQKRNTNPRDASTIVAESRQLTITGRGLSVHDAHDHQHNNLRCGQRAALRKAVKDYPPLKITPPFDISSIASQCALWANRHPACRDKLDRNLMSSLAFYAAKNRYIKKLSNFYVCNPDQQSISKKLNVSVRSVQRRIKRFVVFAVIEVQHQYDDFSGRTMNFYVLRD